MSHHLQLTFAMLIATFVLSGPVLLAQSPTKPSPPVDPKSIPGVSTPSTTPPDVPGPTKRVPKKTTSRADGKKRSAKKSTAISEPGYWFPSWPTPVFDWGLAPVVGIKYTANTDPKLGRTKSVTTEAGLHAGMSGVPLKPGNPGLYMEPGAGYAWGRIVSVAQDKNGDWKTKNLGYKRAWGGSDFTILSGTLSYTLGLDRGRKTFSDASLKPIQSAGLKNDFAVLVTPIFAMHYTHRYLHAFEDQFMRPLLVQHDNWLHGRLAVQMLAFSMDLGPGVTFGRDYNTVDGLYGELAHGETQYLLGLTGMHLFWKLGMSGRTKYVFHSSESQLGTYAGVSLPESGINDVSPISTPEDSFQGSFFFGANDVLYGLGAGWQYNLQMLNVSAKGDKERVTTKDSGFAITYQKGF